MTDTSSDRTFTFTSDELGALSNALFVHEQNLQHALDDPRHSDRYRRTITTAFEKLKALRAKHKL